MAYVTGIIIALFGMALGSFLNVVIDRLPAGQSLVFPASHCPGCQHRLAPGDLIPVFSYLSLRGRCRYCGAHIPQRLLWVELATGLMFAFLWWWYGLTVQFGVMAFYASLLTVILVIDLEHRLILNRVVYPALIPALIIAALVTPGLVKGVMGGGLALAIMFLIAVVSRGGMGWGDVKLAALIGIMVGLPQVLAALFLAIVGGGVVAILLLVLKIKGRKEAIPFGPFLCLAAMATLIWGQGFLDWYQQVVYNLVP